MISGHRQGLVCFWTFKENKIWRELDEKRQLRDEILTGKFGHLFERSIFLNKLIKLNNFNKVFECTVQSSRKDLNGNHKVKCLTLSQDQTKLLISLNTGEIFCYK